MLLRFGAVTPTSWTEDRDYTLTNAKRYSRMRTFIRACEHLFTHVHIDLRMRTIIHACEHLFTHNTGVTLLAPQPTRTGEILAQQIIFLLFRYYFQGFVVTFG